MRKVRDFITGVYILFTVVAFIAAFSVGLIGSVVGDPGMVDFTAKALVFWFFVSLVVYPVMSIAYGLPVRPSVPVPRWRQRYIVNHWYDDPYDCRCHGGCDCHRNG